MTDYTDIKGVIADSIKAKNDFLADEENIKKVSEAADILINCIERGGKIIVFGNGGSAADSQHMAAELIVRFEKERKSLPCIALNTNTSSITASSNDYSFDSIYSRQIEGLATSLDVAIAISTSGISKNILEAVKTSKNKGMSVIGLTGKDGGKLAGQVDVPIVVRNEKTARIQEVHITIIHILCKLVEDAFS